MSRRDELTVFESRERWVDGVADFVAGLASDAINERGRFTIALSGGSTPRPVYERLAEGRLAQPIDWAAVHAFFGDERCVPPDDTQSNFRMAKETLLERCVPQENVHRMRGEDDPAIAAALYEQELRTDFRTAAIPVFDLMLLGMGDNGHTASLFPGTAALHERERLVVPQYVEILGSWRITFTPPLINAARHVVFMILGGSKADMLWKVLHGPFQPDVLPSQLISPVDGRLHWLVDAEAAAKVHA